MFEDHILSDCQKGKPVTIWQISTPSDKGLFSSKLLCSLRRFQEKKVRPLPSCDYDANQQQNLKILSPDQRLNPSQPIKPIRSGSVPLEILLLLTSNWFSHYLLANAKRITPPELLKMMKTFGQIGNTSA